MKNLLPGGKTGNRGGSGTMPVEIRQTAKEYFRNRLADLDELAGNAKSESARIQAIDTLGKYGVGQIQAVVLEGAEWIAKFSELTAEFFKAHFPEDQALEKYQQWWAKIDAEVAGLM